MKPRRAVLKSLSALAFLAVGGATLPVFHAVAVEPRLDYLMFSV